MDTLSLSPAVERQVRCWCGHTALEDFSPDYWRCPECQTLVLREMRGEEISQVRDDDHDFYGKNYYLRHVQEDYGLPDLETRARADLPERCLHWLSTLLKFVPGPGARTLELGCGHGGFVAMQRWAGLDATGLELSPWLVQQARAWFGVPVLEGRLEDQELAPASFDAVILMDVLEHLPDPRATLGRAVSLLRSPQSFLLIQSPCYPVGWSYERLLAENHPFLTQLKPTEHLYLFSEPAVARLCAELGVGQVRFEPAIFAHYDLFAVASAGPLPERQEPERTALLMAASPPARWTQALLDLGAARDDLKLRLVDTAAEARGLRETAGFQHAEINRLWPQVDAAKNADNLAAAKLADLHRQFHGMEADSAARLKIIETQGAELARLHAEADDLWPKIDASRHERNLLAAQMADLRHNFEQSEADRGARLQAIETQGAEIARLHTEADQLWPRLDAAHNERNLLAAQLADSQRQFHDLEGDSAVRLAVIQRQGDETGELRAQLSLTSSELAALRGHFQHSEADSAARLTVIQHQGDEMGELRAQLSLTSSELAALYEHYKESEADRAARLKVIVSQGAAVDQLQTQLDANEGQRARLVTDVDAARANLDAAQTAHAADLDAARSAHAALTGQHARLTAHAAELRAAHDALAGERPRLAADLDQMNAAHAALATEHETLRARHKTLHKHWTTWVLKKLRLWPL